MLAAYSRDLWIPVSNACVAAFAGYLEIKQFDETLTTYNQTASNLGNILCWWESLGTGEKQNSFATLVDKTESVLQTESTRWVQEMHDVLADLYEADRHAAAKTLKPDETEKDTSSNTPEEPNSKSKDLEANGAVVTSQKQEAHTQELQDRIPATVAEAEPIIAQSKSQNNHL